MASDFRAVLRRLTRADHDELDHLVTMLDISRYEGFTTFARVHLSCFLEMQSLQPQESKSAKVLSNMTSALRQDLRTVGAAQAATKPRLPDAIDPLAIDYLVAGSRLGANVLRKRWAHSTDRRVQSAQGYFTLDGDPTLWANTCQALSEVPVSGVRAQAITNDARALFQCFASAFRLAVADEKVAS